MLNRAGQHIYLPEVEDLLRASPERSVDGQDMWIDGPVALAHQHFWITPEEWGERQPLVDATGRWAITADVRLDNRRELIKQLRPLELASEHLSDAALIMLSYQRWETACVERLTGDFAFVIWDSVRRNLFLARDKLGARGLCYTLNDDHFLAASDVGQLLGHRALDRQIDEDKICEHLAGLYQDEEKSYYKNIHYLPPAHCLLVTTDSIQKWRYWDINPSHRIRYPDDREYAEHFFELLEEAVRCRLRTAGSVAISLSGGLDSTALAAVASNLLPATGLPQERLKSFSYVFDELTICDEREFIQPVADRYQLETTLIPSDDKWTLRNLQDWPVPLGYVFSDAYAWLPNAVMTEAGKAGCRVLLAGYYGDVLYGGAQSWAAGMMADLRLGDLALMIAKNKEMINWRRDFVTNGLRYLLPQRLRMLYGRKRRYDILSTYPGLHPDRVDHVEEVMRRELGQPKRRLFAGDLWHRYTSLTANVFSQGLPAVYHQYNSHGVELAMPFWDQSLIEFVMALPADQLGRPWRSRWIFRNAVQDLLPRKVAERKWKTTFEPLMAKGVIGREKNTIAALMENPLVVEWNFVRKEWLAKALKNGKGWYNAGIRSFLWQCVSLELWLKRVTLTL